jgi:hypothetical protein
MKKLPLWRFASSLYWLDSMPHFRDLSLPSHLSAVTPSDESFRLRLSEFRLLSQTESLTVMLR